MSGKKLLVLLAAGFSRRFGPENKLLHELDGLPLYRHTLDKLAALRDEETDVLVMTNTPEIQLYCTENGLCWSPSPEAAEGIAATVRAAVAQAEEKRASACVFFVADQPKLKLSTMRGVLRVGTEQGAALACVKAPTGRGNPVWFGKRYFGALSALRGDVGGRSILAQHSKEVLFYPAEQAEVTDIDTPPCKS